MKQYIGFKRIKADPMTKLTYNILRGWKQPQDEEPAEKGYLVEYLDGGKPNHPDYDNYISWSPKEIFEDAYRESGGIPFSVALEFMKKGYKVARKGWNGKGMWIALGKGSTIHADNFWNPHTRAFAKTQLCEEATVDDYIIMKTAGNTICMGWLASQADMLAEDWEIVE